jgi:ribosome biogenesis GTPase
MSLDAFGWDEALARAYEPWAERPGVEPGRVLIEFNYLYRVQTAQGEVEVVLAGRLKHEAETRGALPAVGDWVVVRRRADESRGAIVAVLPRRTWFSRRAAGHVTDEQVVAANVDAVFIVMGLDADFSLRRLERYLLLARESGASPVVLLTKPDLASDPVALAALATSVTGTSPVHVVNPKQNEGLAPVAQYLARRRTGALLGSSGVGKSTIVNCLVGRDVRRTREVRASDSRGRHTTTHRELVVLPDGGLLIDTPGMRELQLWDVEAAVEQTFDDIQSLAGGCRFTDCRHRGEPRCAGKGAEEDGRLAATRLASSVKLQDELAHLARQRNERALLEEKRRARVLGKALRKHVKAKRG